jgi:hypothetical protein
VLPQDPVDIALQRLRALVAACLVGVVSAGVGHNQLEICDKSAPGRVRARVQFLLHDREAHRALDDAVVLGRATLVHGEDEVALAVGGLNALDDFGQKPEGVGNGFRCSRSCCCLLAGCIAVGAGVEGLLLLLLLWRLGSFPAATVGYVRKDSLLRTRPCCVAAAAVHCP